MNVQNQAAIYSNVVSSRLDKRSGSKSRNQSQRGLSLIEVSVVSAIVLLLAIIGIPAINGFVIENRVPKVGEGIARFIVSHTVNTPVFEESPYLAVNNQFFISQLDDTGVFNVDSQGSSTRILHGLGKNGLVTLVPDQSGAQLKITFTNVHHSACPGLASVLQRVAASIKVENVSVKDASTTYNAIQTRQQCKRGDVNTFEFIVI
ncbi:type 4 pilus major pilin [Paenalcaligenes faecalis]|uniref:type 4 pilus major pilin n=1 Tax=Paenalcaligenes faecalis TaxID=2980099 RepID=UPI0022B998AB|nr:type 4 pilus major pilin [Paenalcaligenes faecalis]